MQRRTTRYQAAVIDDHHILLLRVIDYVSGETFWLLPGGGAESDESPTACVQREVFEETSLTVDVGACLFIDQVRDGIYDTSQTYLCLPRDGTAQPGVEPEVDTPDHAAIQELGWFDLRGPEHWPDLIRHNPITFSLLQRIRESLGYYLS